MAWAKRGTIKGPAGAAGAKSTTPGPVGPAGVAGNKWTVGASAPVSGAGTVAGDMYLNTATNHVSRAVGDGAAAVWTDLGSIEGKPGAGISIQGSTAPTALAAGLGATDAGKAWIITADGPGGGLAWVTGHLAVWTGTKWHDAGEIQGPAGPPGIHGDPGPTGSTGGVGPAPVLTAGAAVAAGASPTVTAVGAGHPGEFVLGLPPGADGTDGGAGPVGPAPTLTAAPAALAPGTVPTVTAGAAGAYVVALPQGVTGAAGGDGADGAKWFTLAGDPPAGGPTGAVAGDMYLNTTTGDVFQLN